MVWVSRTRRSAEERAQARRLGVDRYGRPTARALGVSPRQLRELQPELSPAEAARTSLVLLRRSHAAWERARGAAPVVAGFPSHDGQSREVVPFDLDGPEADGQT